MKTKRVPVLIDDELYRRLKEYSAATDARRPCRSPWAY